MSSITEKRKRLFANQMHKEIFLLFVAAALIPALIATVFLFYLIFHITAEQFGIPEAIAYNIIPAAQRVMFILFFVVPAAVLVILIIAYKVTHKIVGPYDRIVRELNQCVEGFKETPIIIRKGDKFIPLVDKINVLLARLREK